MDDDFRGKREFIDERSVLARPVFHQAEIRFEGNAAVLERNQGIVQTNVITCRPPDIEIVFVEEEYRSLERARKRLNSWSHMRDIVVNSYLARTIKCCTGNGFAVQQSHFPDCISFCSAASALPGLHLLLQHCIRTSWTASRFAALHPHFLDCISFCSTASALPGLHLVLQHCIRTSWTASRFAALHPHFLDCISFCSTASALPGLHLILQHCIRTSWTASHFAALHPHFLDCISFCSTASALPGLHLILQHCIRTSWTANVFAL